MYHIYVSYMVSKLQIKTNHYYGSVNVAKAHIDRSLPHANCYCIEVRDERDQTGVYYTRNDDNTWHRQVIGDKRLPAQEVYPQYVVDMLAEEGGSVYDH